MDDEVREFCVKKNVTLIGKKEKKGFSLIAQLPYWRG